MAKLKGISDKQMELPLEPEPQETLQERFKRLRGEYWDAECSGCTLPRRDCECN